MRRYVADCGVALEAVKAQGGRVIEVDYQTEQYAEASRTVVLASLLLFLAGVIVFGVAALVLSGQFGTDTLLPRRSCNRCNKDKMSVKRDRCEAHSDFNVANCVTSLSNSPFCTVMSV